MMVRVIGGEGEAEQLVSPLQVAVIWWLPAVKSERVKVADPPLTVAVPRLVVPSKNSTVPVGAPCVHVMCAVRVTR